MMAKFAEDDRLELMNAQKRRMRQLQHKREIEQLLEDRRKKLADEVENFVRSKTLKTTLSETTITCRS